MSQRKDGVPEGYHTITPYLAAPAADTLIAFLAEAFGAELRERNTRGDGSVAHAEVQVGDSRLMLCDATPEHPTRPASFYLYVPDADEVYQRALAAGAQSLAEPQDQPYGDRHGGVVDPAGHQWWIATRLAGSPGEQSP
jgi:PhnB protein